MEDKVMVSICCLTYNHGKYIRKALESFVNQITNFEYEILIHDDCSTDNTVEIIKEFEERYPGLIKPIYQEENQHSKGICITYTYQFPRAQGKYIAMCEGDDYWTDLNKLQLQFNAMEMNLNCSFCTHVVQYINEGGELLNKFHPNMDRLLSFNEGIISSDYIFENIFYKNNIPFQTSSYFFRKEDIVDYLNSFQKEIARINTFGDICIVWYLLTVGNCYYFNKIMSNYRENSICSWSNKFINDVSYKISHYYDLINFFNKFNIYTNKKYDNLINTKIEQCEFIIYEIKKDYKAMIQKKYKIFINSYSFKHRIQIFLCAGISYLTNFFTIKRRKK